VTDEARTVDFETQACQTWHDAFDHVQVNIQQMIAQGDRVTMYWKLTSVHGH
jgi:hypothetical protein